jgi:hypothetical protein
LEVVVDADIVVEEVSSVDVEEEKSVVDPTPGSLSSRGVDVVEETVVELCEQGVVEDECPVVDVSAVVVSLNIIAILFLCLYGF